MLFTEPARFGAHWRDAQGECEVAIEGQPCRGPGGELPQCLTTVCRLGTPAATVVTSTYARGVGMVRQEVELLNLLPGFEGAAGVPVPSQPTKGGRSVLRLTEYFVGPR